MHAPRDHSNSTSPDDDSPSDPRFAQRLMMATTIALALAAAAPPGAAQPVFSLTFHGIPKGIPSPCTGAPITEGDLLIPPPPTFLPAPGPLIPPCVAVSAGFGPPFPGLGLPLGPPAIGLPPGVPGFVEVDAISFGTDYAIDGTETPAEVMWAFSVDEFAFGIPAPFPPSVFTTGAGGAAEASADVFIDTVLPAGPLICPGGLVGGNTRLFDANGIGPFPLAPGLMGPPPVEPNPPLVGVPDPGADIDGLDLDPPVALGPLAGGPPLVPIYFSLDAAFFNPVEGVPNSGSAAALGVFPGDVLVSAGPGGPIAVYAPGFLLGIPGPMNDLDALILWENGTGVYEPPIGPYSWVGGATDMIFFSIRPGSAIIGVPDSFCGTPIGPGDILWPPLVAGAPPQKWLDATALGLLPMDNIDALDVVFDCNTNGMPDNFDIAFGTSADADGNGIPDECECPADLNGDGIVSGIDLALLLGSWTGAVVYAPCPPIAPADLNGDCLINGIDLALLLGSWGPC